jgi:hypothetical protein
MYKQYISSILIIALLLQFGCYSGRIVTVDEIISNNDIDELTVMKRDSSKVYFEKPEFTVVNDTLKGQGRYISSHSQFSSFNDFNIPLSDIVAYKTSEFDGVKTTIFIAGTILGLVLLVVLFIWAQGGIKISGP